MVLRTVMKMAWISLTAEEWFEAGTEAEENWG
jgi:hypothetical protein